MGGGRGVTLTDDGQAERAAGHTLEDLSRRRHPVGGKRRHQWTLVSLMGRSDISSIIIESNIIVRYIEI